MPISLAQPPQAVQELTQARIKEISSAGHFRVASLATAKPEQISIASGHPVYNLGLQEVVNNTPPANLQLSSWRFIVQGNGPEPTAAETLPAVAARAAEFSSVNSGPFVAGTTEAFASVMKDPTFTSGNWEIRLLRIPALYLFAVWVHEQNGSDDRLRPINPAPAYLDTAKTYTWNDFLAAIKPEAQQKLSSDVDGKS
jgi:hypothetical protein